MAIIKLLLCYLVLSAEYRIISSLTDPGDAAVLQSLKQQWKSTPENWNTSDPCGTSWEGVSCNNSRVTGLILSMYYILGELGDDITRLTELITLDLSFNPSLGGTLSPRLGDLQKLNALMLNGCNFTGDIPNELGNLAELTFLSLSSNYLTGDIPPSLGNLTKLQWLDLAGNKLTGSIPVSTTTSPGLDLLKNAQQFRFSANQLSGSLPEQLFSSSMALAQIYFDENQFSGEIPSTLGLVQTLEYLWLDGNALTGNFPSNFNNLTNLKGLKLQNNKLSGPIPDLSGMNSLVYVDLSSNTFQESEAPAWFSTLPSLTILLMNYGSLSGPVPRELFTLSSIQSVYLMNNLFSGTLDMSNVGKQLGTVELQNNNITTLTISSQYNNTLILTGNPVCSYAPVNTTYCQQ